MCIRLIVQSRRLKSVVLAFAAAFFVQTCPAQPNPGTTQGSAPPVRWMTGPAKVNLGDATEIAVPEGFRFADQNGARVVLEGMKNPIPNNLAGLLFPPAGAGGKPEWFAILSYLPIGYVKDGDGNRLDSASILDSVRRNLGVASMEWEMSPVYDASANKLEYALRAGIPGAGNINRSASFLGRRGVLTIIGVYPYQPNVNFAQFQELAKGISFRNGQRYADFQNGDRVARSGLTQLVTDKNSGSALSEIVATMTRSKAVWAGAGLVVALGLCGLAVLVVRRSRSRNAIRANGRHAAASTLEISEHAHNGNGNGARASSGNGANNSRRNGKPSKNGLARRKRQVNYHAFYSDMVMSLTRCNYGKNYESNDADQEYHAPAQHAGATPMQDSAQMQILAVETSRLIESQQKLIEGQRKLIEEQGNLIREKSKLIDAENKVLEKQTEFLLDQHHLL